MQCKPETEKFTNRKASKPLTGTAAVKRERRLAERKKAINNRRATAAYDQWDRYIRGKEHDLVREVEPNA